MIYNKNTCTGRHRGLMLSHCRNNGCHLGWDQRFVLLCSAGSSMGACDWPYRLEARQKTRDSPAPTYPTFSALWCCLCNSRKISRFHFYILNVFCLFCVLGFKVLFSDFKVFSSFQTDFYFLKSSFFQFKYLFQCERLCVCHMQWLRAHSLKAECSCFNPGSPTS